MPQEKDDKLTDDESSEILEVDFEEPLPKLFYPQLVSFIQLKILHSFDTQPNSKYLLHCSVWLSVVPVVRFFPSV